MIHGRLKEEQAGCTSGKEGWARTKLEGKHLLLVPGVKNVSRRNAEVTSG